MAVSAEGVQTLAAVREVRGLVAARDSWCWEDEACVSAEGWLPDHETHHLILFQFSHSRPPRADLPAKGRLFLLQAG